MRILPLMVPLMALAVLLLIPDREEPRGAAADVADAREDLSADPNDEVPLPPGAIWLSHDWIEMPKPSDPPDLRRAIRRKTFGIDALPGISDCSDPGCRACLIDLVYGREF